MGVSTTIPFVEPRCMEAAPDARINTTLSRSFSGCRRRIESATLEITGMEGPPPTTPPTPPAILLDHVLRRTSP
jgi:hypothetical protein